MIWWVLSSHSRALCQRHFTFSFVKMTRFANGPFTGWLRDQYPFFLKQLLWLMGASDSCRLYMGVNELSGAPAFLKNLISWLTLFHSGTRCLWDSFFGFFRQLWGTDPFWCVSTSYSCLCIARGNFTPAISFPTMRSQHRLHHQWRNLCHGVLNIYSPRLAVERH